ncbi:MAG TPA: hypothetical protein VMY88_01890 [Acidimicrobiales bacterium]|nr:hypothetical protein [Acidimicrobiales bacterium]
MTGAAADRPLETGWLADTPVADTLLRQFLHNQAGVNACLATAKGGRTDSHDGVLLADARSSVPYFNQAILTRPLADSQEPALDRVEQFYEGAGRPATLLSIWPTPDLSQRGWTLAGHPAFVVRAPAPVDEVARDQVSVRTAESGEDLLVAERVLIEGYPMDEAAGEPPGSQLPTALLGSELVVRIGSLGDQAVATGMNYVGHGLINLCGGATLPAARRRGVWEALVWARVSDAPELPAVAYTSDYSRPGFIRMGFLPFTRFTLWLRHF